MVVISRKPRHGGGCSDWRASEGPGRSSPGPVALPLRPRERPWRPRKKAGVQVRWFGLALVGRWPPQGRVSVKCLGLPPGPLQEKQPCAGSQGLPPPPHPRSPRPGAPGTGRPSRLPAQPPLPAPTRARSDYLSAPQSPAWVRAAAPPHPDTGLPSRLLAPEPWCCPAPAPAEAPPWMWTFFCYCEVLFMKNVEGEGSRPPEAGDPLPCTPTPFPAPAAPLPPQGAPQTSIALAPVQGGPGPGVGAEGAAPTSHWSHLAKREGSSLFSQ